MLYNLSTKITKALQSKIFFRLIVGWFIIESGWIAISSSYPMAFDEDFHFGIIKLYAKQWSPFFAHQPVGGDSFGALTSDPSYLYHYLMSFPYRLVSLFTHYQPYQIVSLRFIDIMLMACGLVIFKKVLLKTTASQALINSTLLLFTLIPIVPMLAGQINYDDLLIPLTGLAILICLNFREQVVKGRLSIPLLLELFAVCMFTSLVQYEFLPIFAAIAAYVFVSVWRLNRQVKILLNKDNTSLKSWHTVKRSYRLGYIVMFFVALLLFGGRYGTNLADYKSPVPQCNQVLTVTQCSAYTPWLRNYTDELQKNSFDINPLKYTGKWVYGMYYHTFYNSSGGASSDAMYVHSNPLPIIAKTAIITFSLGLLLLMYDIFRGNKILKEHPHIGFLLYISLSYMFFLWLWNYHDYLHLGAAVALNGRYLLPVMLPVLLAIGLAYRERLLKHANLKVGLMVIVSLLFLQGGGVLTFIDVSNSHWYWAQSSLQRNMNSDAQKVIKPLIIS
jgi:hypothetical protein